MDEIVLPRPDDLHLHLRDGEALRVTVPATARQFGRAVAMPNLKPPVTTVDAALAYRERILAHVPEGLRFAPLMTLYLTDATPPDEVRRAKDAGVIGVKLYPAGATTHSDAGVSQLDALDDTLAAMAEVGLPLLVHGEVTDHEVDIFDREAVFIDTVAGPLLQRHPTLRFVFEHATTADAVAFVRGFGDGRVGCTITPQHLLMNRGALFDGGLRPHHYCLPVLKRERHRVALLEAATSGDARFFLGTDSAPHLRGAKESSCGCAGCFSAPYALELYAMAFERAGALERLAGFASRHGAAFYGLPVAEEQVRLVREEVVVEARLDYPGGEIVPLWAGERLPWRFVG